MREWKKKSKSETVEKLTGIFGTSFAILKGCEDGLKEIFSSLKQYNLSSKQKEYVKYSIGEYVLKNNYIEKEKKESLGPLLNQWTRNFFIICICRLYLYKLLLLLAIDGQPILFAISSNFIIEKLV